MEEWLAPPINSSKPYQLSKSPQLPLKFSLSNIKNSLLRLESSHLPSRHLPRWHFFCFFSCDIKNKVSIQQYNEHLKKGFFKSFHSAIYQIVNQDKLLEFVEFSIWGSRKKRGNIQVKSQRVTGNNNNRMSRVWLWMESGSLQWKSLSENNEFLHIDLPYAELTSRIQRFLTCCSDH